MSGGAFLGAASDHSAGSIDDPLMPCPTKRGPATLLAHIRWQEMARDGKREQEMARDGKRWQEMARDGSWPTVEHVGYLGF